MKRDFCDMCDRDATNTSFPTLTTYVAATSSHRIITRGYDLCDECPKWLESQFECRGRVKLCKND